MGKVENVNRSIRGVRMLLLAVVASLLAVGCGGSAEPKGGSGGKSAPDKPSASELESATLKLATAVQAIMVLTDGLAKQSEFTDGELAEQTRASDTVAALDGLEVAAEPVSLADAEDLDEGVVYVSSDHGYYDLVLVERVDEHWYLLDRQDRNFPSGDDDRGPYLAEDLEGLLKKPLKNWPCDGEASGGAPGC